VSSEAHCSDGIFELLCLNIISAITLKDAVKVGMALVATMCAIVLGLLVSSAKSSYDAQSTELTEMSAKVVLLDRVLESITVLRRRNCASCSALLQRPLSTDWNPKFPAKLPV
jgi:hypothetical protein